MAVSGSKDFEPNVADYVEEAFERCGSEFRTGYDAVTSRRSLNFLFADWANRGLNRWTINQVSQTVVSGLAEYPAGTITATVGSSADLVVGNTITGQLSASTAVILTKPSSTTITLSIPSGAFTAGETISSSASDESGVTTTISADPSIADVRGTIDILSSVVRRSGTDISISRVSREDFLSIPNKTTTGRPTQFYVDRQITPVVRIWPTPENSTDIFIYDRLLRIDDADASVDTVEVPFRFYPCLAAGLAYYLSLKIAPERTQLLKSIYEEEFTRAAEEDRDRASFSIIPSYNYLSATS
jgi:hypothetical protein|tara:strand:- start:3580 stop:4479 length:900 start_codon:yes stop_codon:yes gene_type:complete